MTAPPPPDRRRRFRRSRPLARPATDPSAAGTRADSEAEADADADAARIQARRATLQAALDRLATSGAAPVRVMRLVDDESVSARQVADAVDADPILTARLLRLANSAAYGQARSIATTSRAVSVVGFASVKALAASLAAGATGDGEGPPGFREHAANCAAACVAVSAGFGLARDEAFVLGLLHDLGWPILHAVDPDGHRAIRGVAPDSARQCELERERFGLSHAEAAATVLDSWNFPPHMVGAIASHHDPIEATFAADATPQSRVLAAGDALARAVLGSDAEPDGSPTLDDLGYSPDAVDRLVEFTRSYATEILDSILV